MEVGIRICCVVAQQRSLSNFDYERFMLGGYGTLAKRMAEGLDIRLNTAVEKIEYHTTNTTTPTCTCAKSAGSAEQ